MKGYLNKRFFLGILTGVLLIVAGLYGYNRYERGYSHTIEECCEHILVTSFSPNPSDGRVAYFMTSGWQERIPITDVLDASNILEQGVGHKFIITYTVDRRFARNGQELSRSYKNLTWRKASPQEQRVACFY